MNATGETTTRLTLTIVVVNYNHAHFLPRCLAAIIAQTRAPDEVLFIDDGSTDDSVNVALRFASQLPRFRLIRHEVNQGVVAGLNDGLGESASTHVLFAAADDWIEPDMVDKSMAVLERHPAAGLCSALTLIADEAGTITGPLRTAVPLRTSGYLAPDQVAALLISDDGWFNGNTVVVNREAAIDAGGYRAELRAFTDMFMNTTLSVRHGACFVPALLAVWRRLDVGYAAATTSNPDAMLQVLRSAQGLMFTKQDQHLFWKRYAARWTGRWRFAAARAVIAPRPLAAQDTLRQLLPERFQAIAPVLSRLAAIPVVGAAAATIGLFLLLRLPDIGPVFRRRMTWALMGAQLGRGRT